ncbi:MAG: hypothetical protein K2W85_14405 [Phycisphaerales bacterium]|nr:hypothetical protein [Phycisphaerales bacterium]
MRQASTFMLLTFIALTGMSMRALAQSQQGASGDERGGAVIVTTGQAFLADLWTATSNPGDPQLECVDGYAPRRTTWFSFLSQSPTVFVSARGSRDEDDVVIAVFSQSETGITLVGCSSHGARDDETETSLCLNNLTVGEPYVVMIGRFFDSGMKAIVTINNGCPAWQIAPCHLPTGTCVLLEGSACAFAGGRWAQDDASCSVQCPSGPPNDSWLSPTVLNPQGAPQRVSIDCSADDSQLSWFGLGPTLRRGVWFRVAGTGATLRVICSTPERTLSSTAVAFCDSGNAIDLLTVAQVYGEPEAEEGVFLEWCSEVGKSYLIVFGLHWSPSQSGFADVWVEDLGTCSPVTRCCRADANFNGGLDSQDIFDFLNFYFTQDQRADYNRDGAIDNADLFDFLNAYFAGC